ncbi:hypothetical protein E2C11_16620 [Streptomyces lavendulae]|nr:hypothetical protein [Streptomyces lavendulae]TXJ78630.1 hypothetical protein E2C11_16620 [Streptomyces lavendulae]
MSRRYALQGAISRDLLTWNGRVLVHSDRAEMEFLFAGEVRVIECPRDIPPEQTLDIRYHPQLATVQWPLDRQDFR